MSYDERDAAMDEMYERIGDELHPEHRVQAIDEFTADRLGSYYLANPWLCAPPSMLSRRRSASRLTDITQQPSCFAPRQSSCS